MTRSRDFYTPNTRNTEILDLEPKIELERRVRRLHYSRTVGVFNAYLMKRLGGRCDDREIIE